MDNKISDLNNINALIEKGATFFVSHSGGKDSQAMYALISQLVPHDQIVVFHCDLGEEVEWEGTVKHIEENTNHEVHITKSTTKTFVQMVERRGMFPGIQYRQCTSDLKTGPSERFIRQYANKHGLEYVINCTGVRAYEPDKRKKKIIKNGSFCENKKISAPTKNRYGYNWNPLAWFTEEKVFQVIEEAGQKPHYAYGLGMSRLSCCFCIMASKTDLRISAKANPEKFQIIVELEKKINHTMFMEKSKPIRIEEYIKENVA